MTAKVHDIRSFNLADVPARLRAFADEIEASGVQLRCCAIVLDPVDAPIGVTAFGRDGDLLRTIGLLHTAATDLATSIMAEAYADSGFPPAS
jgi:hypothetical protein